MIAPAAARMAGRACGTHRLPLWLRSLFEPLLVAVALAFCLAVLNLMSGPDLKLAGQKRSYSDSTNSVLLKETVVHSALDPFNTSNLYKIYGNKLVNESFGRSRDDEFSFSMQAPPTPTSVPLIPSLGSKPGSVAPMLEQSGSANHEQIVPQALISNQIGSKLGIISSAYAHKDFSVGATIISQPAADEGSRTGIVRSGMNISQSNMAGDRNLLPFSSRAKISTDINCGSFNMPRSHATAITRCQMTIFYAGQAHVFDDVHPNKAEVIMALAGSSGESWSTTYAPKSNPSVEEVPAQEEILEGNQGGFDFKDERQMTEATPQKQNAE